MAVGNAQENHGIGIPVIILGVTEGCTDLGQKIFAASQEKRIIEEILTP